MKRLAICSLILASCVLLFTVQLFAADKIAYVNLMRIAKEYTKAQDYNKALEDKQESYKKEIDKKENEFKQFQDKINLLNEKEKEAKKPELETKAQALYSFVRQKEEDLRKADFDNTKEILADIENVVKQYAEKEGYSLVLDDRVLIYQTKAMDITDKVIETLNKGYKK